MEILLMMAVVFFGYIIMYRFYGKFLSRKIFHLSGNAETPAVKYEDGIDFVPTKKEVIFGHHFTSIAGTGPIVGPAIAIIWGWLPALIWVFLGSAIMGAVHDFGALVISLRNQGKSISEFTAKYINSRTRFFFFVIVFLALWIVISIFGLVIAIIFNMYPSSVFPVWLQIPIAVYLGHLIYKKGKNIFTWSVIALFVMYGSVIVGNYMPLAMPSFFGIAPTGIWTIILLIYAYIASVLPVTTLLQPRDFINAYQLIVAMVLLGLGAFSASIFGNMEVVAPAVQMSPENAPPMWPFLFITIACGAISGFHSLVASGTTAKQVRSESDSLFVGYGSMLVEGSLATLVIIAVSAGIGMGYTNQAGTTLYGIEAWSTHYSSWTAAAGLGSKVSAFVVGAANMMATIGIPKQIGIVVMGLFVASFAGTTLDTATRIQRYVVTELGTDMKIELFRNRYISTAFVVITAALLAFASGSSGKGALTLWPLFGAVNQTLAALALIIITLYLKSKGGLKWVIAGVPAIFMSVMTLWASVMNQVEFGTSQNLLLQIVNGVIIFIVLWVIGEGLIKFFSPNRVPELTEETVDIV
ncbi:MAG: carbon starvation protein A [Calditrichaceae bacterium]